MPDVWSLDFAVPLVFLAMLVPALKTRVDYEVALFVYDPGFAKALRGLQQTYLADADRLDPAAWATRSFGQRFLENALRLASPLL